MIDKYASALLLELKDRGTARFSELGGILRNPRTLSKKLKELRSLGMVECKDGIYSLSEKGRRAAELVQSWKELLEGPKAEIKNLYRIPHPVYGGVLRRYCELLLNHFKERLKGVLLFGSVARGDWTPSSDLDLLIVVEGWRKPTWERIRELMRLEDELRNTPEYTQALKAGYIPIIQEYPLDEEEALRTQRIYIDACMEGIILYERDGFLTHIFDNLRKRMMELGSRRISTPDGKHYWVLWQGRAGEVFEL